jgi:hypothetical protein
MRKRECQPRQGREAQVTRLVTDDIDIDVIRDGRSILLSIVIPDGDEYLPDEPESHLEPVSKLPVGNHPSHKPKSGRSGKASTNGTTTTDAYSEHIRSWARSQGLPVKDGGRLSNDVIKKYNDAHTVSPVPFIPAQTTTTNGSDNT